MGRKEAEREFNNKNVLVIGMGTSGLAVARLLRRAGAQVRINDNRTAKDLASAVTAAESMGAGVDLGQNRFWPQADLVVASPGVPRHIAAFEDAEKAGVPVLGEMEIGYRFCDAPITGITGTDGKSTVVTMVDHILTMTGHPHLTGGNLDIPLSALAADPKMDRAEGVVLEISSYQLEAVDQFHARVGAILNVAPDHISRYRDLTHYAMTKWNVTHNQTSHDALVLRTDHPAEYTGQTQARIVQFGEGAGIGSSCGSGAFYDNGVITCRTTCGEERVEAPGFGEAPWHVRINALASIAIAGEWGVAAKDSLAALETYKPLPHRIEFCGEFDGVAYYNDSKATNIHAASAAIRTMTRPFRILCGGKPKGEDFARLAALLEDARVRGVYCFGEAGPAIAAALSGRGAVKTVKTMEDAVRAAVHDAASGEAVLLSPACASFDGFANFEERGDRFRSLVWELNK